MASTPEAKVKKAVIEILKRLGIYYFFPVTSGYGHSGVPDIICCVKGYFVGVECKSGKNEPTALQEAEIVKIKNSGGVALVIKEGDIEWLEQYLKTLST